MADPIIKGMAPEAPKQPPAPAAPLDYSGPAQGGRAATCTGPWNPVPDTKPTDGNAGGPGAQGGDGVPGLSGDNGTTLSIAVSEFLDGLIISLPGGQGGRGADGAAGGRGQDGGSGGSG